MAALRRGISPTFIRFHMSGSTNSSTLSEWSTRWAALSGVKSARRGTITAP